jgi:hypothetical protein
MANMRARKMSATLCLTNRRSRASAINGASVSANPKAALSGGQQHDAAVGGDATAVERRNDLLAFNRWEIEPQQAIVKHGGYGSRIAVNWMVLTPTSVNTINALRDTASESLPCS